MDGCSGWMDGYMVGWTAVSVDMSVHRCRRSNFRRAAPGFNFGHDFELGFDSEFLVYVRPG